MLKSAHPQTQGKPVPANQGGLVCALKEQTWWLSEFQEVDVFLGLGARLCPG